MSARLGIVVVYLLPEGFSRLLEIHLERIARHASVPYTIYGCAVRLQSRDLELLQARPELRLVEILPTELRGSDEHSYYLERLIDAAKQDGATHVVTLHVDSFPVRDGWDGELIDRISPTRVFASLKGIHTACLLFSVGFHNLHRPTLLISATEAASGAYRAYLASCKPQVHSGVGYGYVAWQKGLEWHLMEETTAKDAPQGAGIYGDVLFHLNGALRLGNLPAPAMPRGCRGLDTVMIEAVFRIARALVPERIRLAVRARFKRLFEELFDEPRLRPMARRMVDARDQLFTDPDGYIESVRG